MTQRPKPMHEFELVTRKQAYEEAFPCFDRFQEQLEKGAELKKQDGKWWLFAKDGEGICCGNDIRGLMLNLIWTVC